MPAAASTLIDRVRSLDSLASFIALSSAADAGVPIVSADVTFAVAVAELFSLRVAFARDGADCVVGSGGAGDGGVLVAVGCASGVAPVALAEELGATGGATLLLGGGALGAVLLALGAMPPALGTLEALALGTAVGALFGGVGVGVSNASATAVVATKVPKTHNACS
jgi:hypothetical protein